MLLPVVGVDEDMLMKAGFSDLSTKALARRGPTVADSTPFERTLSFCSANRLWKHLLFRESIHGR